MPAPAGADTVAASERECGFCGSGHCCGSGKYRQRLLQEQTLLRQWKIQTMAPAGADTAAAVEKYRCKLLRERGAAGMVEVEMNGDGLELKGAADEGLVGFLDVGVVRSNVALETFWRPSVWICCWERPV